MTTLTTALRAADLTVTGWLAAGEVAVILRAPYDPAAAPALERHGQLGRSLATAGPVAVTETWDRLRSDSALHAVLWVSDWPRSQVYPGFLAPILLSSGIQRVFSLTCTPIRADQAARDIRKKKTGLISDAAQRAKFGQIEDAAQTAEYAGALQQEADLTAGHGDRAGREHPLWERARGAHHRHHRLPRHRLRDRPSVLAALRSDPGPARRAGLRRHLIHRARSDSPPDER